MNRMKRIGNSRIALAAAALSLAVTAGTAAAQNGPRGGGRGMLRHAMASLDLSQDQKDKIQAVLQTAKPEMAPLRQQMRDDARALKSAADSGADAATVGQAFLKVRGDRQALKAERQKVRAQVEALLTPAQKTKLDGYLAAVKGRRHGFAGGN